MIAPPIPEPGISDMSPNSAGRCESPSKASIAAIMIRSRYNPSRRGARAEAWDVSFAITTEAILIATGRGNWNPRFVLTASGRFNRPYCHGYHAFCPLIQGLQSFLLSEKCLERVYRRQRRLGRCRLPT